MLHIAFIYPKRFSFYPPDYLGRGLGGTESTLVLLTKALAARGHRVSVYNACYKPGVYDGVSWKEYWAIDPSEKFDVVISLRLLETFTGNVFNAPIRAVWIHDEALLGSEALDVAGTVNLWITVSNTQKEFISRNQQIKDDHWFVTRNAFDEDLYAPFLKTQKKNQNQVIYCSSPDRGLKYLLQAWPKIKNQIPDAKLIVTGSYALWGTSDEENSRIFAETYGPGLVLKDVSLLQRVTKERLAQLQAESELMIYPTDFNEMFCISALECMAVGTPLVTSDRAALKERVENGVDGVLIKGEPGSEAYQNEFIATTVKFLKDKTVLQEYAKKGTDKVRTMDFSHLAEEWEIEFKKRLEQ